MIIQPESNLLRTTRISGRQVQEVLRGRKRRRFVRSGSSSISEESISFSSSSSSSVASVQIVPCTICLNGLASEFYEFDLVVSGTEYHYRLRQSTFQCVWYNEEYLETGVLGDLTAQLQIKLPGYIQGYIQVDITNPSSATYHKSFPRFPLSGRPNCLESMTVPFFGQFSYFSWPSELILEPVP